MRKRQEILQLTQIVVVILNISFIQKKLQYKRQIDVKLARRSYSTMNEYLANNFS